MKLNWNKLGKIFDPADHRTQWMFSYSQNPNVLELEDRLRIYFTCRPPKDSIGETVSITAFADFENKVLKVTHTNHTLDEKLYKLVKQRFEHHLRDDGAHFLMPALWTL